MNGTKLDNLYHTELFAPFVASLTLDLAKKLCDQIEKKAKPPFGQRTGRSFVAQTISIYTLYESFIRLASEGSEPFDWQMFPMETLEATLQHPFLRQTGYRIGPVRDILSR